MAGGEADVTAVDHRHRALLLVCDAVCAIGVAPPGTLAEDPGLVPTDLRLALAVDEEERDDPMFLVPTDGAPYHDLGLLFRQDPLRISPSESGTGAHLRARGCSHLDG